MKELFPVIHNFDNLKARIYFELIQITGVLQNLNQ